MVGFTLLSRSYYYLRRRSPGPPFPPDHRQAGERGAIIQCLPLALRQTGICVDGLPPRLLLPEVLSNDKYLVDFDLVALCVCLLSCDTRIL